MAETNHSAGQRNILPRACRRCGVITARTNNRQQYCEPCRTAQKRNADARWRADNTQRRRNTVAEWAARNAEKVAGIKRSWAAKNPDKARAARRRWQAAWAKDNPEEARRRCRVWYSDNNDAARESARVRMGVRLQDPSARLQQRIGAAVRASLKGQKAGVPWEAILGYTTAQLRDHLERQFTKGMSWKNHGNGDGRWHLDHIQPRISFKFDGPSDPEFKACWALTNLRPLWAKENLIKSGKRTLLL